MVQVEVFKTDITNPQRAREIVTLIQETFEGCQANVALDDCDRILRVRYPDGISLDRMVSFLAEHGVEVGVLES